MSNSTPPANDSPRPASPPPRARPELVVLLGRIGRLLLLYVRGQLLMSLIIGGLTAVVGLALGLKGAVFLGLLAGLLETIPNVGSLIALVPAVVVALLQGSTIIPVENWTFALIVVGAYFLVQQVGSLVIQPRLVGKSLDLPPFIVLLAVLLGAALFNVVGAYLAVPVVVIVREVGRYLWRKAKRLPPFEDAQEPTSVTPNPPFAAS
jgi:predicted PurR-regulated permease PerM